MATVPLEERVAALERQVAQLLAQQNAGKPPKDWRDTLGMFTDDDVMKQITDAALAYRAADREAAHTDPNYFQDEIE
jgi:hypothetical protein